MITYFAVIWKFFIVEPVSGIYVHRFGALVFFSWFLLATVGSNLSKYSVAGIEAAILMEPRWAPMSAAQLMDHGTHSWSGPSGWLHLMKNPIPPRVSLASGRTSSLYNNHTSTDALGLVHEYLHEVLIWQQIVKDSGRNASNHKFPRASIDDYDITVSNNGTIKYNTTIDYDLAVDFPVQGLEVPSLTYNGIDYPQLSHDATVVGIRCFSSSAVGAASINPSTATFTNFQRINPLELTGQFEKQGPTEFGYGVVDVFVGYPRDYFTENVFRSVGVVPLVQLGGEKGDATWIHTSYLQAEQLRKSMHRAFAGYALALVYDNTTTGWL
ncbi:hypothetical protein GTA08_BOTSDO07952 [Botryosphaeria dothidea]|uniref:Uncharacterized protein n=1 Tax=Botryosphaeria dothidea TaxID=55169 RepID=A0A8H4IMW5_9PEZI|nr:hypothetical protein GTA08_BOTSDO07952 [Botryosphaeria dothidea]